MVHEIQVTTNIHSIKLTGEAASADEAAVAACPQKFQEIVEQGNYPADLIFNFDETVLYCKKWHLKLLFREKNVALLDLKRPRID